MSKKLFSILAVLLVATMLLGACAPAATEAPAEKKFLACQVTDTGGIDDKSFNATAWKGVTDAIDQLGVEGKYLESKEAADYEKNINAFIEEDCDIIITVGYLLNDATKAAAEANPDFKFSIVDSTYDPAISNVAAQAYQTDQASFMAGYLAAGVTKTGKVGTFGGMQIPTVTIFMDGFVRGVAYYNEVHGTSVEALGWDTEAQTGLFTNDFNDQQKGSEMAVSLMDEGADIIMPVAGPVGLGSAAAIKTRGSGYLIGVDYDWFVSAPEYKDILLTSVLKVMDLATLNIIKSAQDGTFKGGTIVGTLESGGVGLASFHDLDSVVSADLKAELETLKADIISGKIEMNPAFAQK
ncbi:MAG: BMP family ABC transporter substrate-binding protein [Chloroflexi bacterium]|nr:BMP family ABC transporter substrate-binding protein [Chloroflexota bacterium]